MRSRETVVGIACIAIAVPATYAVSQVSGDRAWAPFAVLFGVGVLLPLLVNEYLDTGSGRDLE